MSKFWRWRATQHSTYVTPSAIDVHMVKMVNLLYISLQPKDGERNLNVYLFMNLRSGGNTGPRWAERPDSSPTYPHPCTQWCWSGHCDMGHFCSRRAGPGTEQKLCPRRVMSKLPEQAEHSEGARDTVVASSNQASVYPSV